MSASSPRANASLEEQSLGENSAKNGHHRCSLDEVSKSIKHRCSLHTPHVHRPKMSWTAAASSVVTTELLQQHVSIASAFDGHDKGSRKTLSHLSDVQMFCHKWYTPIFIACLVCFNLAGFTIPQVYSQMHDWRDVNKDEENPNLMKRYRTFNQANVPPLRSWFGGSDSYGKKFEHFKSLATRAYSPPAGVNCTHAFSEMLEARLSALNGKTNPVMIQRTLDLFELTNISEVRDLPAIEALLTAPQDFRQMLHRASSCAETNAPLRAWACSALSDPSLMTRLQGGTAFIEDELNWALHLGVTLETITAAAIDSTGFRAAVHWQMTLIANRVYERIKVHVEYNPEARQYFQEFEKTFRKQKFHSMESAERNHHIFQIGSGDLHTAVGLQLQLGMNILEAGHLELIDRVHPNVELALVLAVGAQGPLPYVTGVQQLYWPLGKAYADAYIAWNFEYVSRFETVQHPVKLLIPTLLCSDSEAGHFIDARSFSLKLFIVWITNRRDMNYLLYKNGSRGNGVWNATLSERRAMSQIFLENSRLPLPSDTKYGYGSVEKLFDELDPPQGWLDFITSSLDKEWFLLYTTIVVWITVILAGFGSEVVLGEHLVKNMIHGHGNHEWMSVAWHAAQLSFSLFLTVALFAHGAIGLPFLVVGLWKMGFPETVSCFLAAFVKGGTIEGFCSFLDGTGFVLHHTTTAFTIVSLNTGLFPATQQTIGCCVIPVMQHWFVLLKYHSRLAYVAIMLGLEVVFQIEVLTYISYFVTPWGLKFDRLGRGCAITMLLSHWLWFFSSCVRKLKPLLEKVEEEVLEVSCDAADAVQTAQRMATTATTAASDMATTAVACTTSAATTVAACSATAMHAAGDATVNAAELAISKPKKLLKHTSTLSQWGMYAAQAACRSSHVD